MQVSFQVSFELTCDNAERDSACPSPKAIITDVPTAEVYPRARSEIAVALEALRLA